MFRGSVKCTGYPIHSPVFPSLPLTCFTIWHHISTGIYKQFCANRLRFQAGEIETIFHYTIPKWGSHNKDLSLSSPRSKFVPFCSSLNITNFLIFKPLPTIAQNRQKPAFFPLREKTLELSLNILLTRRVWNNKSSKLKPKPQTLHSIELTVPLSSLVINFF